MKFRLRWYQFSLRSLLIFVGLVCLVLSGAVSLWTWYLCPAAELRRALCAIDKLGGHVESHHDRLDRKKGVAAIRWVSFYNDPSLDRVTLNDAGLGSLKRLLEGLPTLRAVDLSGTHVTAAGLTHLEALAELTHLRLWKVNVTDAGLEHVKGFSNLRLLELGRCGITDAGLVHLKGLSKLEHLDLSGNQITDAGLVHLQGLTKLELLDLRRTLVTEKGIQGLHKALPKCQIKHDL